MNTLTMVWPLKSHQAVHIDDRRAHACAARVIVARS
jgi:hypothetical protein